MLNWEKPPTWLRAVEVLLGLVTIGFGIADIAVPALAVATLILILSIGLLILGLREIIVGASGTFLPKWVRGVSIVAGLVTLIFSAYVLAFPGIAALTLVLFLYIALFARGLGLLTLGGMARTMSRATRAAYAAVGLLSVILAIVFLVFPSLAIATLILVLSIGLVVTGIEVIVAGVTGRSIISPVTTPSSSLKM